jgi:heavy metal sensor kinase
MRPVSLKLRISLLVTGVLVAVIATISAVAYIEVRESIRRNLDHTLQAMSQAVLAELEEAAPLPEMQREVAAIMGSSSRHHSARFRIWVQGQATDLASSDAADSPQGRWLRNLPTERQPQMGKETFFSVGVSGLEYRATWVRRTSGRGDTNILLARSSHHDYNEMREFLNVLLTLGGCTVLVSAALATLLVVLAMRPVAQTARRLGRVTYRNLGAEHLADLRTPSELEPFRDAVAELLTRLDQAARRQKQFAADASHELRTPLSLAKSTLQLARSRKRDLGELEKAIDEALTDFDRMARLIDQLLVLARLDETNGDGLAEDVDLPALLAELAGTYDTRVARAGGRVICADLPPTRIRGEWALLERLFANLLDNALKHGPAGGTIRLTLRGEPDGTCAVGVHDEGGSIPPEALGRLFDRFFRVDDSRTSATGGTGLGLAIAREIALRHGGDIQIASSPESGTLVSVRLPRLL